MGAQAEERTYRVTLYREDSVTTVLYERVKHTFWTADHSVLVIAQLDDDGPGHHYVHWLREHLCWFKVDREAPASGGSERAEELEGGLPLPVRSNGHHQVA